MISHGLISAALFLCVGVLYDRMHSRMINNYGGVVSYLPKFSFLFIIFALSALGLPGTAGFVGEFLILIGVFKKSFLIAILASTGVVFAAAYMLWLSKRVIFGEVKNNRIKELNDLNFSEKFILSILLITTLFFGFYPEPLIETTSVSIDNLINNYNLEVAINLEEAK